MKFVTNRAVVVEGKYDAARIGFDDAFIYRELELSPEMRRLRTEILLPDEARKAFDDWAGKDDKVEY